MSKNNLKNYMLTSVKVKNIHCLVKHKMAKNLLFHFESKIDNHIFKVISKWNIVL